MMLKWTGYVVMLECIQNNYIGLRGFEVVPSAQNL